MRATDPKPLLVLLALACLEVGAASPIICPRADQEGGNRYSCESWQTVKASPAATDLALRCEWSTTAGAPIGSCGDQRWTQWSQIDAGRFVLVEGGVWALKSSTGSTSPPVTPPTPEPPTTPTWTGDMVLSWTPPTLNTDGTSIVPPITYRVTVDGTVRATVSTLTYTVTGLAPGQHCATLAAITSGGTSAETGAACKTIAEPTPTCTAPQPAAETRTAQCTAPQVGAWTQARTYVAAAYPTCWSAGEWTPAAPPAGVCTTPVPTPVVVPVVAGLSHSPVFGISGTGTRGTTVLGFVAAGKPCTGAVVYSYRGRSYRRVASADVIWWASTPTSNAAVACQ